MSHSLRVRSPRPLRHLARAITALACVTGASSARAAPPTASSSPSPAPAPAPAGRDAPPAAGADVADPLGVGWSVGALVGAATSSAFGPGIGLRVGDTLPSRLYVGGTGVYHAGGSVDFGPASINYSYYYLAGEVGYDVPVASGLVLRPFGGLGLGNFSTTVHYGVSGGPSDTSASSSGAVILAGADLLYVVSPNLALGVDARLLIVSSGGSTPSGLSGASASGPSTTPLFLGATAAYRF